MARDTWEFFARHVGPQSHHLPPDNVQTLPQLMVAERTSPTNIGLYLLSAACARRLKWISTDEFLDRCENTLQTLAKLQRHRGHFLNWYDTRTLQPLPPLYVSTVDSGNLAGHLLTLRAGLLALADEPVASTRVFEGLGDTLGVLAEALELAAGSSVDTRLSACRTALEAARLAPPATLPALHARLAALSACATDLLAGIEAGPTKVSK